MPFTKTLCFIFSILFVVSGLNAQYENNYTPKETKETLRNKFKTSIEKQYNQDLTNIERKKKEDYIYDFYTNRYQRLINRIEEDHFFLDDFIQPYLDNILNEIIDVNPSLQNEKIRLLASKYPWPNATCHGEGTLVFNIGLLQRLENDSQVAFVIAHELAHHLEDHVNYTVKERIARLTSKETKQEIDRIRKSEYNTFSQALDLFKDFIYDDRKHSRLYESEADSIAIVLIKNTHFNINEGLKCLSILDMVDEKKSDEQGLLKAFFDNESYPFKDRWLEKETTMTIQSDSEEWDQDSLKTHPDCTQRIASLESHFGLSMPSTVTNDSPTLNEIKLVSSFEEVQYAYDYGHYAMCIKSATTLLKDYPGNLYLVNKIGQSMYEVYQAQKAHELNKYVPLPDSVIESPYQDVLRFIHNMRLSEIAKISYATLNNRKEKILEDEDCIYTYFLWSKLLEKEEETKTIIKIYNEKFPEGKYELK